MVPIEITYLKVVYILLILVIFYGNTFFSKMTKSDIYSVKQSDNEAYHICT